MGSDHSILANEEGKHVDSKPDVKCECGSSLQLRTAQNTYKEYSSVICDICNELLAPSTTIYHCPSKYIHPKGWDVCQQCVIKLNDKMNKVKHYAIIIQGPLLSKGIKCSNDGVKLANFLRKELKYKQKNIQLIQNENVNAKNISLIITRLKQKLKQSDVVTIFFSGHGLVMFKEHYFELYNKQLFKSSALQEMVLQNLSDYNVLFLINSCHSGVFGDRIKNSTERCSLCEVKVNSGYKFPCGHVCCGSCCDLVVYARASRRFTKKCHLCMDEPTAQSIFAKSDKSMKGQNLMAILSCNASQESNFWYPMSPFVKYVINGLQNKMNTPSKLLHYIQQEYRKPNSELSGISLLELDQALNSISYGSTDFLLYNPNI